MGFVSAEEVHFRFNFTMAHDFSLPLASTPMQVTLPTRFITKTAHLLAVITIMFDIVRSHVLGTCHATVFMGSCCILVGRHVTSWSWFVRRT
jgi:hypothetical protein